MAWIKLNYELALQQATKISNAGKQCTEVAAAINKQIGLIQESWKGESANAVIEKLTGIMKDLSSMETTLCTLASKVRSKADQIKAIDEEESDIS